MQMIKSLFFTFLSAFLGAAIALLALHFLDITFSTKKFLIFDSEKSTFIVGFLCCIVCGAVVTWERVSQAIKKVKDDPAYQLWKKVSHPDYRG
jgi:uncharacterized membrane protein YidH (DUF202 family)